VGILPRKVEKEIWAILDWCREDRLKEEDMVRYEEPTETERQFEEARLQLRAERARVEGLEFELQKVATKLVDTEKEVDQLKAVALEAEYALALIKCIASANLTSAETRVSAVVHVIEAHQRAKSGKGEECPK